jgi:hypothetical protein
MMAKLITEVIGTAGVTVNKDGVLISKDGKVGTDLIDEAVANQGEIRSITPKAVEQQRRQAPRTFPQGTPPNPGKAPATTPATQPPGTKP